MGGSIEERQFRRMTTVPVKKLVVVLAIPTVISMLVTSIYNLADTFFVSQLGVSASGAVGVVFPIMAIIQAIGFTLGNGGGSNISAKLGEKKNDEAQVVGSSSFFVAILFGLVITFFGVVFLDDILVLLGSTPTILPFARDYAKYIFFGAPVMASSFVLNNILRSEGKAKFSMIGLTFGGVLNIFLDPLFIYVFNLGISGAAIATLVSQCVSFLILFSFFVRGKSIIRLSFRNISFKLSNYVEIVNVGLPSFFRQGLASVSSILLNLQAGGYGGDPALSGMSIVSKVFMVIFAVALGIGQGYQPVCGYNYSSGNYRRVREAMLFTFVSCTLVMSVMAVVFYLLSDSLVFSFMSKDVEDVGEVVRVGGQALRFQCLAMPLMGVNLICNMTYQATRKKFLATLLSVCRQGLFFIPLVFVLPGVFGLVGVELVQPVSDLLTCLFSLPFLFYFLRKLKLLSYSA